ncbi:MAG: type I-U CRISPR-associated protein Cas5/Cas6 [Candidatus Rokubacteria bacterium]|nr:type I-U CRISPR-associated protein Cas5/Cas6 [Candidatus Rokubacteria bacterium]
MSTWLCIEVTLLAARYHGRRRGGEEAEWPPAPHRLFSALLAAAHLGTRTLEWSEAKAQAFRWLEEIDPPEIVAACATPSSPFTLSVPNNDMDVIAREWARGKEEKKPSELRALKTLRPHRLDGDATVCFCWRLDGSGASRAHAEVLCAEARHLHHLGLGIDLVVGLGRILTQTEKDALPGDVWIPDPRGDSARAPMRGSFDELVERHRAFLERVSGKRISPPTPPAVVRRVDYGRRAAGEARRAHAFVLATAEGAMASFDAKRCLHVAAWLRHAAHRAAQTLRLDEPFTNSFVCGHGEDDSTRARRFSYVPLPSIGHPHVDGRIRRVLIVEPLGDTDPCAPTVVRALANGELIDERGAVRALLRPPGRGKDAMEIIRRYVAAATTWGSVTPVLLPGLDDRRSRKAAGLVLKALGQAGYPTPVAEVSVQAEPVFAGAAMSREYVVAEHLRHWPRVHVIVRFSERVPGPVIVGAGRHSGLGVFAALED